MNNYGIKISKPGYDIDNASIANQIFNSQKNCIKLSQITGTVSSTLGYYESEIHEIVHGFNFTPGFLVWFEIDNNGKWFFMYTGKQAGIYAGTITAVPYSDDTKLYIELSNQDNDPHTIKAHFVVFADKGA